MLEGRGEFCSTYRCDIIPSSKGCNFWQLYGKVVNAVNERVDLLASLGASVYRANVLLIVTGESGIVCEYKNGKFEIIPEVLIKFLGKEGIIIRLLKIQYKPS